jgi:thiol-disulfide isomerase/thioredoxin
VTGALRGSLFVAATCLVCFAAAVPAFGQAVEPPRPIVVFFYQEGCPDCVQIGEVLDLLAGDLPDGAVARYEITDPEGKRLFRRLQKAYGIDISSVPLVFVGDRVIAGASRAQELTLSDALGDCTTAPCPSPLDRLPPDVFPWVDLAQLGLLGLLVALLFFLQRP